MHSPPQPKNLSSHCADRIIMAAARSQEAATCGLCSEVGKYKCSKCHDVRYCSVNCFKLHQPDCVPRKKQKTDPVVPRSGATSSIQAPITLQPTQLDTLRTDADIRLAVQNKELQAIIRSISSSSHRQAALELALNTNADFADFVDTMLAKIGHQSEARADVQLELAERELEAFLAKMVQEQP